MEDNFSIAPQVFISRLPIRTSTHVSSYLNKLLVYETSPNSLNNWPNRILMCGNLLHSYLSNSPLKSDAEVYGETIYNKLHPKYPTMSLATVYKALEVLVHSLMANIILPTNSAALSMSILAVKKL